MKAKHNRLTQNSKFSYRRLQPRNIHNKIFLFIIGIGMIGTFYQIFGRALPVVQFPRLTPSKQPVSQEPQSFLSKQLPTLSPSLILYSQLKNSPYQDTELFTDNILKVGFSYPKKYFFQSFKADERNPYAAIFVLKKRNDEKEKIISYYINCELDDRQRHFGMCREGMISDLEIDINTANKVPDMDEDIGSECVKETFMKNKIIYSCLTNLAPNPYDKGMRYSIYLIADTPKVITISTRQPEEFSDLITSIGSSAKVNN